MMTHKGTQAIQTRRLILRQFRIEDTQDMFRNWASDAEVTKYMTWPTHSNAEISRMVLTDWVSGYQRPDFYQWAIEYEGQPVGSISVTEHNDDIGMAEIGYCIGRKWWHKGITSEALQAVIAYLFDEVGYRRIQARHDPRNPHSGAVMRKCGMSYEGTYRQGDRNNQGICDASMYAILASD